MKRIFGSIGMLAFVGALVWGATGAFFTDTETSTGNVFTAGAIDLKIDNQSYVTSTTTGNLVASPTTSWQLADLTNQLFFNFDDLKPGDIGEDTISLHVNNNDAYICMDVTLTGTPENSQTEPEAKVDQTVGVNDGELQNAVKFAWWADDGDNVYEANEVIFKEGTAASLFAANQSKWALADSMNNVWGGQGPVPGDSVRYIAKFWCFGDMTAAPLSQDGQTNVGPLTRGTGFQCTGVNSGNETQTDGMTVDVTFESVQSRNNNQFKCNAEVCTPITTGLFSDGFESNNFNSWTNADDGNGEWSIVSGGAHGGSDYAITFSDTGNSADELRKSVSTSGYNNLTLSYWYKVINGQELGINDHVLVQWRVNSGLWNTVADHTNIGNTNGWIQKVIDLPVGAANNPTFEFRFTSNLDGSSYDDVFKLDDVSLSGKTICPAPEL